MQIWKKKNFGQILKIEYIHQPQRLFILDTEDLRFGPQLLLYYRRSQGAGLRANGGQKNHMGMNSHVLIKDQKPFQEIVFSEALVMALYLHSLLAPGIGCLVFHRAGISQKSEFRVFRFGAKCLLNQEAPWRTLFSSGHQTKLHINWEAEQRISLFFFRVPGILDSLVNSIRQLAQLTQVSYHTNPGFLENIDVCAMNIRYVCASYQASEQSNGVSVLLHSLF